MKNAPALCIRDGGILLMLYLTFRFVIVSLLYISDSAARKRMTTFVPYHWLSKANLSFNASFVDGRKAEWRKVSLNESHIRGKELKLIL